MIHYQIYDPRIESEFFFKIFEDHRIDRCHKLVCVKQKMRWRELHTIDRNKIKA